MNFSFLCCVLSLCIAFVFAKGRISCLKIFYFILLIILLDPAPYMSGYDDRNLYFETPTFHYFIKAEISEGSPNNYTEVYLAQTFYFFYFFLFFFLLFFFNELNLQLIL